MTCARKAREVGRVSEVARAPGGEVGAREAVDKRRQAEREREAGRMPRTASSSVVGWTMVGTKP